MSCERGEGQREGGGGKRGAQAQAIGDEDARLPVGASVIYINEPGGEGGLREVEGGRRWAPTPSANPPPPLYRPPSFFYKSKSKSKGRRTVRVRVRARARRQSKRRVREICEQFRYMIYVVIIGTRVQGSRFRV